MPFPFCLPPPPPPSVEVTMSFKRRSHFREDTLPREAEGSRKLSPLVKTGAKYGAVTIDFKGLVFKLVIVLIQLPEGYMYKVMA